MMTQLLPGQTPSEPVIHDDTAAAWSNTKRNLSSVKWQIYEVLPRFPGNFMRDSISQC
jgi:hypothetical protein